MNDFPTLYIDRADHPDNDRLRELTGFGVGDRVIIRGGFEDGIAGVVVSNEPDRTRANPYTVDRPFRFRVRYERCPYCGEGKCSGSARTANGRDVERWAEVHTSGHPNPGTIGGLAPAQLDPLDEDDTYREYSWSRASALWQLEHGEPDTPRTCSAREYLEAITEGE